VLDWEVYKLVDWQKPGPTPKPHVKWTFSSTGALHFRGKVEREQREDISKESGDTRVESGMRCYIGHEMIWERGGEKVVLEVI